MRDQWSIKRFFPLLFLAAAIFYLSHFPGSSFPVPPIPHADKIVHCILYLLLTAAALYAIPGLLLQKHPVKVSLGVVAFIALYAWSDEFHQRFVPGRFSSGADIVADMVGAIIALVCIFWYQRLRRN